MNNKQLLSLVLFILSSDSSAAFVVTTTTTTTAAQELTNNRRPIFHSGHTSSAQRAALVPQPTTASGNRIHRIRRWPKRIWSKLSPGSGSSARSRGEDRPLRMQMPKQAELSASSEHYDNVDFILKNFNTKNPQTELPGLTEQHISEAAIAYVDSEFFDVSIKASPQEILEEPLLDQLQRSKSKRNISLGGAVSLLAENTLGNIVNRLTAEEPGFLQVNAKLRGMRLMTRLLFRGELSADVDMEFGRLIFPNLHLTSGRLETKRMTVNLFNALQRFPKQFDLNFDDLLLTKDDLWNSACMKNGLRQLLVRLLRDRGVKSSSIKITSLGIMSSGKIYCKGEATTLFGSTLPFEVRTGISTASRGHVLTFPGLEICLNRDLGFFVPVVPSIDVDIGHNARVRDIHIDGTSKQLKLSASVTITPANTIRVEGYRQSKDAFAARFSIDVGKWLTNLGRWTGPAVV